MVCVVDIRKHLKLPAEAPVRECPLRELCYPRLYTCLRTVGSKFGGFAVPHGQHGALGDPSPVLLDTCTRVAQTSIQRQRSIWICLQSPPTCGLAQQ